jgi:DNA-binding transcriptional LysR family regulator
METDRVRALLCAVREGSLSAAAAELGYTPSGMSRMIGALEDEVGVELLRRNRQGVEPTRACRELMPAMQKLAAAGAGLRQQITEMNGVMTGDVVVATAYPIFYMPLARLIGDFSREYPGITVKIREGRSSELMKGVEENDIDFCMISRREGKCDWTPLFYNEFIAWVPDGHPSIKKGHYNIEDFEKEPVIGMYEGLDSDEARVFRERGIHPDYRYASYDTFATYKMVEAGLGISGNNGLYDGIWDGSVVSLSLEPKVEIEIGIATPVSVEITPAARRFREFALGFFSDHRLLADKKLTPFSRLPDDK